MATPHAHFALPRAQKQWDVFTSHAMHHAACQFRTRSRERRRSRRRASRPGSSCQPSHPRACLERNPSRTERSDRVLSFRSTFLSSDYVRVRFAVRTRNQPIAAQQPITGNSSSFLHRIFDFRIPTSVRHTPAPAAPSSLLPAQLSPRRPTLRTVPNLTLDVAPHRMISLTHTNPAVQDHLLFIFTHLARSLHSCRALTPVHSRLVHTSSRLSHLSPLPRSRLRSRPRMPP